MRQVTAVTRAGRFGTWRYLLVTDPPALTQELDRLAGVANLPLDLA